MPALLERSRLNGFAPVAQRPLLEDRTGQPLGNAELLAFEGALPVFREGGRAMDPALFALLGGALHGGGIGTTSVTSYRIAVTVEGSGLIRLIAPDHPADPPTVVWHSTRAPLVRESLATKPVVEPVVTPAEELRTVTGLPPSLLAGIFDVSRTTFYKWLEGAMPRDARLQHLLDVLAHTKEAQQRLPSSVDFGVWLRTPIAPGASKPIDYLRDRRFQVFRGLVLRAASASGTPEVRSVLPSRYVDRQLRAIERERISPRPLIGEED